MFNLKKLNLRTLLRKSSNSINKNFSINKKPPKPIGNDNSDKKKQVKRENAHLEEDNNDDFKEATENFLKNINHVEGEDSKEIESFIKNFNNKLYKQNEQLTLKIGEMFENSDQKSHLLIFTAINEINKVNLSNTSKLLKIFLIESLRSREISLNNNKSNGGNYPWILLILFGTLGYLFFYYSTRIVC